MQQDARHQRSVQSTIHEVSNGCKNEEAADILSTNQKRSGIDIYDNEQEQKFSFQE